MTKMNEFQQYLFLLFKVFFSHTETLDPFFCLWYNKNKKQWVKASVTYETLLRCSYSFKKFTESSNLIFLRMLEKLKYAGILCIMI